MSAEGLKSSEVLLFTHRGHFPPHNLPPRDPGLPGPGCSVHVVLQRGWGGKGEHSEIPKSSLAAPQCSDGWPQEKGDHHMLSFLSISTWTHPSLTSNTQTCTEVGCKKGMQSCEQGTWGVLPSSSVPLSESHPDPTASAALRKAMSETPGGRKGGCATKEVQRQL